MASFKKPFGHWRAKRLKIIDRFNVQIKDFRKEKPNIPDSLLSEILQLEGKLADSGKRNFEIVLFKISPRISYPGVAAELEFRKKRSANFIELLSLSDKLADLAGRVVISVSSRWKRIGGRSDFYWGLDFRGGRVQVKTFAADVGRPKRACFAYVFW